MRVVCAWCRREGRAGVLGEREPLDDPTETHGICQRHAERELENVPAPSFPGVRLLIVVAASEDKLFSHLEQAFAALPYVAVILDRRRDERRGRAAGAPVERRRGERRLRAVRFSPLGYQLIRFGAGGRATSRTHI